MTTRNTTTPTLKASTDRDQEVNAFMNACGCGCDDDCDCGPGCC